MTHNDQLTFIHELCSSIEASIRMQILADKVPAQWDSFELRELVYEKALASRARRLREQRTRFADYHNTVLVNNL